MSDQTLDEKIYGTRGAELLADPRGAIEEALREYAGDGEGLDEEILARFVAQQLKFPKATRVTVVGPEGVAFENYQVYSSGGAWVSLQDAGRTIKILPRNAGAVSP